MTQGLNAGLLGPTGGLVVTVPPGPLPGSAGASFSVEPDKAQACIDGLRATASDLDRAVKVLDRAYVDTPAEDVVSRNFAVQACRMADRAVAFVVAWQNQLLDTAQALDQQLRAYRAADENNRARFT